LKVDPVDSEKTIQYADASAERTPQPQEPDENELEPEMSDPQLLRRLKSELMDLDEAGPEQIQAQQDDETGLIASRTRRSWETSLRNWRPEKLVWTWRRLRQLKEVQMKMKTNSRL
jgi:hypothetical protein